MGVLIEVLWTRDSWSRDMELAEFLEGRFPFGAELRSLLANRDDPRPMALALTDIGHCSASRLNTRREYTIGSAGLAGFANSHT